MLLSQTAAEHEMVGSMFRMGKYYEKRISGQALTRLLTVTLKGVCKKPLAKDYVVSLYIHRDQHDIILT